MLQNLKKHTLLLSGGFLLSALFIISFYLFVLTDKNNEIVVHATNIQEQVLPTTQEKKPLEKCFSLQENRDSCYFSFCENQNPYLCTEDLLEQITRISGPEQAMDALHDMKKSYIFDIQIGEHLLAHIIGRTTSSHYGLNSAAFSRCPTDFNYGCQHGFLENALEKESDPVKAATSICGNDFSSSCYHGVGHGFVFHTSYNLMDALSLCDQLLLSLAQKRCYRGVFMENTIGFSQDINGEMGFLADDFLAPCNRIQDKYRTQCWQEHGTYLLEQYDWSIKDASRFCLTTGEYIHDCMVSLGYTTIGTRIQGKMGEIAETAAYLCKQFPPDYIETCKNITMHNFILINEITSHKTSIDIVDTSNFCLAFQSDIHDCFEKMGAKLIEIVIDNKELIEGCNIAPEEYRESCYQGGGITDTYQDTSMPSL